MERLRWDRGPDFPSQLAISMALVLAGVEIASEISDRHVGQDSK